MIALCLDIQGFTLFPCLLTREGRQDSLLSIFLRLLHPTQPTPAQANIDSDLSSGEYYKRT